MGIHEETIITAENFLGQFDVWDPNKLHPEGRFANFGSGWIVSPIPGIAGRLNWEQSESGLEL